MSTFLSEIIFPETVPLRKSYATRADVSSEERRISENIFPEERFSSLRGQFASRSAPHHLRFTNRM